MRTALAVAILLAAFAAPAQAKEISKAEVCGANRCVDVEPDTSLVEGGYAGKQPPGGAAFVKLRVTVRGEKTPGEPVPHDSWTSRFAPAQGLLRNVDGDWMILQPGAVVILRAAARRVQPFHLAARPVAAKPPAPATPAPAPAPDDFPWVVVVGAALGALVTAVAVRFTLRRRAAAQP